MASSRPNVGWRPPAGTVPSSTTDEQLLDLIERARSAAAHEIDSDSDPAATTLLARHAHRRALELEWDERDTVRRATELMATWAHSPPNHLVDPDDGDDDDDDDDDDNDDEFVDSNDELDAEDTALWPGLLGEQPLNPDSPTRSCKSPSASATAKAKAKAKAQETLDPSSSTCFTSFLAPGSSFIGQQVTTRRRPTSTRVVHTQHRLPPATDSNRLVRPTSSFESSRAGADSSRGLGTSAPNETSSSSPSSSSTTTTGRYAPYSSHTAVGGPSTSHDSVATVPHLPIPPNLTPVERARASIARSANPLARSDPASWRQVADELLVRLRTDDDDETARNNGQDGPIDSAAAVTGGGQSHQVPHQAESREEERWDVQVNIDSYDPVEGRLTGLMSAYGIQSSVRDLACHPTRVTTFFSASIVNPLGSGLFVSPSPTGSGGRVDSNEGIRVSQSTEAEAWIEVGPFKGMKKHDLIKSAQDRAWVERKTTGWVLMRWKERDFINVKASESSLSINGFYFVALDRSTGVIEGLYSDPASSPHQRLDLSPCGPNGAFSPGEYAMC